MKNFGFEKLFSSVKLTIILLLLIAVISVLGTIIPQGGEAAEAMRSRFSPFAASILQAFQLFDVYHSALFATLLGLLCINLIVCSSKRFSSCLRQYRRRLPDIPPDVSAVTFVSSHDASTETLRLEKLLRKRHGGITLTKEKGKVLIYSDRGRISYFGAYIVHAGILVIIAGALVGVFGGFSAYIAIGEGQSSDRVYLERGHDFKKLGFTLRCDRFSLEFYGDGSPKSYKSDISFLQNGRIVMQVPVTVNHPIAFAGLRFYQSDYGVVPHGPFTLHITGSREERYVPNLASGKEFDLPGGPVVHVMRVEENFMGMGPAVKLDIAAPEGHEKLWIFQNIAAMENANPGLFVKMPMLDPSLFHPFRFFLIPTYYTGLKVNYDPGVPIVAAGSLLFVVGIISVFFYDHRQFWIRLLEKQGKTEVTIAGTSNRNRVGVERELVRIVRDAKGKGEKNA